MITPSMIEERRKIQKVMAKTFQNELQILNSDFQSILIDDMITAFFNRLNVLKRAQIKQ